MKTNLPRVGFGLLLLSAATCIFGQAAAPAPSGYLHGGPTPDLLLILPPAPVSGDMRDTADRAIFKATRSLEGSPRWKMAATDDEYHAPAVLQDFSCSLGASPTPKNAPRLSAMVARIVQDSSDIAVAAKAKYKRKRPFLVDEGHICVPHGGYLETSFDYPSGHSTEGWAIALVLAEIVPDRSSEILARGRAYGDSRVFCGVHNASAVEAGRLVGASLVSALHASEKFKADFQAVQAELTALRQKDPYTSDSCTAEAQAVAMSPYTAAQH